LEDPARATIVGENVIALAALPAVPGPNVTIEAVRRLHAMDLAMSELIREFDGLGKTGICRHHRLGAHSGTVAESEASGGVSLVT
jgi:hypothetical protein